MSSQAGLSSKEKLTPTPKAVSAPSLSAANAEYLRKLEKSRKGQRRRRKGRRDEEEEEEAPPPPPAVEEPPVQEEEEELIRDRRRRGRRHRGRDEMERKVEEPKKEILETELQQRRKLQTVIAQPVPPAEKVPKRAYDPAAIMEESKNFDLLYGIQLSLEHHKKEQLRESREKGENYEHKPRGNANHLLNFQFNTAVGPGPNTARTYQPVKKKKGNVFKKEAFLQANCHFVLSSGDSPSLSDPEHVVDWMAVEQVYMPTEKIPLCPICLDPPVAGKITRCGHIFCSACMLHYLSLSQKSWARCPLCFESIYKKALKSVSFRVQEPCVTGRVMEFLLIKRARGSLVASFVDISATSSIEKGEVLDNSLFARITVTTDISSIIAREYSELTQALQSPGLDIGDTIFLRQAIEELAVRQQQWDEHQQRPQVLEDGLIKPNLKILQRPVKLEWQSSESDVAPQSDAVGEASPPPSPVVSSLPPNGSVTILKRQPVQPSSQSSTLCEPASSSLSPSCPSPLLIPATNNSQAPSFRLLQRPTSAVKPLNPNAREFCFAGEDVAVPKPTEDAVSKPTEDVAAPKPTEDVTAKPPEDVAVPKPTEDVAVPKPTEDAESAMRSQSESGVTLHIQQEAESHPPQESEPVLRTQGSALRTQSESQVSTSSGESELIFSSEDEASEDDGDEGDDKSKLTIDWDEKSYHFYQRQDGAYVFMHPFNYRCLQRQYEKEENFPAKLSGKVLYLDKYVQTEDTVKSMQFLNHLPLGSPFFVAILDLGDVLSRATTKTCASEFAEFLAKRAAEQKRAAQLAPRTETHDPGLLDHTQNLDARFALADAEGQFPELMQDAHNQANVTPLGWNEVAEKGFCANFWSPSLADAQNIQGEISTASHKLGGAAAASLSLLTKPKVKAEVVIPQIPTGAWNKNGPPPKKVAPPVVKEKSTSSWDSPVTPLYSDSLLSSQFSTLSFMSSTSADSTSELPRPNALLASGLKPGTSSLPAPPISSSRPISLFSSPLPPSSTSDTVPVPVPSKNLSDASTTTLPASGSSATSSTVTAPRRAVLQLKPLKKTQEPKESTERKESVKNEQASVDAT